MKCLKHLFVLMILILLWQLACSSGKWSSYVLSPPQKVFDSMIHMIYSKQLFLHIFISLQRVLLGYSIGFILAFCLAILSSIKPTWNEYYSPYIEFMRNVPPLSLIALLILWFGIGETSKIIIIVLASFFPMFLNIKKGILSCDPKLLEVGEAYNFSYPDKFFKIILPFALPDILVGMRIGLGYSWRAIIGAEMIAASSGLGYLILDAQQLSRSDKVIVGIITIGTIGILCDKLFAWFIKKRIYGDRKHEQTWN